MEFSFPGTVGTPPHLGTVTLPLGTHLGKYDYSSSLLPIITLGFADTTQPAGSHPAMTPVESLPPLLTWLAALSPHPHLAGVCWSTEWKANIFSGAPLHTALGFPPTTHDGLVARSWKRMRRMKRGGGGEQGTRRWRGCRGTRDRWC